MMEDRKRFAVGQHISVVKVDEEHPTQALPERHLPVLLARHLGCSIVELETGSVRG